MRKHDTLLELVGVAWPHNQVHHWEAFFSFLFRATNLFFTGNIERMKNECYNNTKLLSQSTFSFYRKHTCTH